MKSKAKNPSSKVAVVSKKDAAKKFLKKDHTDQNMLVAIRIRPLNGQEISRNEQEIIRAEDKLLVSFFVTNSPFLDRA
jgi:hypothetical protein